MRLAEKICVFLHRKKLRGATRFHRVVLNGSRLPCKTKHGIEMLLDPLEYVDSKILQNGYYEEEVLSAIQQRLSPGECFWDVGSNLGLHALTISKLYEKVTVFAFEPNPSMAEQIGLSGRRNSLEVETISTALHNRESTETFFLHEGNQGRGGLHNWDSDPTLSQIDVEAARADYLVETSNIQLPNVIKIDVEGHELQVLEGMTELLNHKQVHTIIFEDSKEEKSEVQDLLISRGFKIERLARMENTHHDLENYSAIRDVEHLVSPDAQETK